MNLRKSKLFILPILVGFILVSCGKSDKRVLGTINGETYTVDKFLSLFLTSDMIKENRENIMDQDIVVGFEQLTSFTVLSGEAAKEDFFNKNTEAKKKLEDQVTALKQASYKRYVEDNFIKPMIDKVSLKDKDLDSYKKRVQVRHILLSKDGKMKDESVGLALEQEILTKLKNGADFAELAKEYSEDPGSKDSGGLISQWIYKDSPFVAEFKDAALKATKNKEIIPDIRSAFGLHIIYIENIQNRSISDIKDNDPQTYNKVLNELKNKTIEDFKTSLLKSFPAEANPDADFQKVFKNYEQEKETVLYTINKNTKYTAQDFVQDVFQGNTAMLSNITEAPNLEEIINAYGVLPKIIELFAKKEGIDKDSFQKQALSTQEVIVKGNIYLMHLLDTKGPKQQPVPVFKATETEMKEYYENNKAIFTQPGENGAKPIVEKYETAKKQISSIIIQDKTQQFKQEEEMKKTEFMKSQVTPRYEEYKITFNKDFIKPTNNESSSNSK